MTANDYLRSVIERYSLSGSEISAAENITGAIKDLFVRAYGQRICGSPIISRCHKMSRDRMSLDIEIVVHFESDSFGTVKEMYDSVFDMLSRFHDTTKQHFSVRVSIGDHRVVIIPVRVLDKVSMDGEIYDRRRSGPLRTNILRQREYVRQSKHHDAVTLMRIWKYRNRLKVSTFLLELITIHALSDETSDKLDAQVTKVLEFMRYGMDDLVLIDPGNSENDVAGTLTSDDRKVLNVESCLSLSRTRWMDII